MSKSDGFERVHGLARIARTAFDTLEVEEAVIVALAGVTDHYARIVMLDFGTHGVALSGVEVGRATVGAMLAPLKNGVGFSHGWMIY